MRCRQVNLPGITAVVCGNFPKQAACVVCGHAAPRLCDWKIERGKTCDAPLCDDHTHEPAPEKDLCPRHKERWLSIKNAQTRRA